MEGLRVVLYTFDSDRLRTARIERGLSRAALACALDVTEAAVQSWEWGVRAPAAPRLLALADVLGVYPEDLFTKATA